MVELAKYLPKRVTKIATRAVKDAVAKVTDR